MPGDKPLNIRTQDPAPGQPAVDEGKARGIDPGALGTKKTIAGRNNYLLLIAIDRYSDSTHDLVNPVRDANALLEVLLQRYRVSPKDYREFNSAEQLHAYESGTYVTLKDKENAVGRNRYAGAAEKYKVFNSERIVCLYNEDATVDKISVAVNKLVNGMVENGQLLIYFAGHGKREDNKQGKPFYLCPHEYDSNKTSTYLRLDTLTDIANTNNCRNLLLIVDACYGGAAGFGNKHQTDKPYSREIFTSCSAEQKAADGTKFTGSPFSRILVSYLQDNAKYSEMKISNLSTQVENILSRDAEGKKQDIFFGSPPTFENGSETFVFELANSSSPDVVLFAESIINHLNFRPERAYIKETIDFYTPSRNQNYYLISSVTNNAKIERLRGNIISKSFAGILRRRSETEFKLQKYPVPLTWDMIGVKQVSDIFDKLANKVNLGAVGLDQPDSIAELSLVEKIEYFSHSIGRRLEASPDAKFHNPLCVGFIITHFLPATHSTILSEFIVTLVKDIENFKGLTENKEKTWDKLILYVVSEKEKDVNESNGFTGDCSKCVIDLFKSKNLGEPFFHSFEQIAAIRPQVISSWLIDVGDSFDAKKFGEFKKEQLANSNFPSGENLGLDTVMDLLADKLAYNPNSKMQLFDILFFNNK